jgi:hypothetical protein
VEALRSIEAARHAVEIRFKVKKTPNDFGACLSLFLLPELQPARLERTGETLFVEKARGCAANGPGRPYSSINPSE